MSGNDGYQTVGEGEATVKVVCEVPAWAGKQVGDFVQMLCATLSNPDFQQCLLTLGAVIRTPEGRVATGGTACGVIKHRVDDCDFASAAGMTAAAALHRMGHICSTADEELSERAWDRFDKTLATQLAAKPGVNRPIADSVVRLSTSVVHRDPTEGGAL